MDKKIKLVMEWFKKADNDLKAAEAIIEIKSPPTDTICFHCQQCAEKYLKGFLIFYEIEFEKTHDLHQLLDLCKQVDKSFDELRAAADMLNPYAVEIRYPDNFYEYSIDEAREAISLARKIKKFVLEKFQDKLFQK